MVSKLKQDKELIQKIAANFDEEGGLKPIVPGQTLNYGVQKNRALLGEILDSFLSLGSGIVNAKGLKEFYQLAKKGEPCLLLVEHYSNFDYPNLYRLIEKDPELGKDIADSILAIQGIKLLEESSFLTHIARSYRTITIAPRRGMENEKDPKKRDELIEQGHQLNKGSMKILSHEKRNGEMILLFPSGTRTRQWDPSSKQGVPEVASYLKNFHNILFVAINGSTLQPTKNENMEEDYLQEDIVLLTCSDVVKSSDYRTEISKRADLSSKQDVANEVMKTLEGLHKKGHEERIKRFKEINKEPTESN